MSFIIRSFSLSNRKEHSSIRTTHSDLQLFLSFLWPYQITREDSFDDEMKINTMGLDIYFVFSSGCIGTPITLGVYVYSIEMAEKEKYQGKPSLINGYGLAPMYHKKERKKKEEN